jgi:outer membrane protein
MTIKGEYVMKRIWKVLAASLVMVGILSSLAAAANIGFIDVQKVFNGYKETSKAQEELSKKEKDFKTKFEESQKKIEDAKKDGKKEAEVEKLTKELEEKLAPQRKELLSLNEALTGKLQGDIVSSVTAVAKDVGIDIVVDKQVIITGGVDITELVLSKLNKK